MNQAGLQMLHVMYLDTGNTTGFWDAVKDYRGSSTYRLVCFSTIPLCCLFLVLGHRDFFSKQQACKDDRHNRNTQEVAALYACM